MAALIPCLVVGLACVLLTLTFPRLLTPLKAVTGFLLSVLATFGVTVAVFRSGRLSDAPRGELRGAGRRPRATQRLDRLRHPSLRPLASSTISPSATAARTRRLSNDEKASPPAPAASRSVMAAARWTASKPRSA